MSNLYKKLNISALDVFKFNRYYKFDNIMSRKITSENVVESTYLKVADDNTYIYANESSPLNNINELSTAGLSEVCIKYKDNNNYNNEYKYFPFYIGYSLTYTQSVEVNGINAYLYAFSHINGISNINTIVETMNINVIHNPKNNEESVNVYSDVTYSLCNITGSLTNNSTLNLTAGNIKSIIGPNSYGSASFDISYSYVTSDDGYIHDDGKCIVDELTGVHVWSMNSYIDDEQYSYQDTDYNSTEPFIVYTYINASQTLLNKLENSGTNYLSYALIDVSDDNWWSQDNFKFVKTSNNQAYLMYEETKHQYFNHLRPYNLTYNNGTCTVDYRQPFSNIYRYPSWRYNKDYYYACQKMKTYVGNLSSIYPKLSDNFNNFNTSYFIKKIGNLPVHIVPQSLQFELIVKLSFINSQSSGDNPEEGAIRFYKIELYDNDNIKKYTINFKDDKTINLTPYNINDGEIKRTLRISSVEEFEIDNDEYFKISDWKTTPNSSSFIPSFDPNNEHGNEYKISFKLTEKSQYSINNFYKFIENNSIINKIRIYLEATGSVIGKTGPSFDINVEGTNDNSYYMGKKINGNYEYDIIEITRNNNETEHINGTITYISTMLNYYGLIHDGDNKN